MKIKFKNKMTITKKLFIITTIIFAVFIASTLIIQSLFFEKFYISKKQSDLKASVEKFKADYNKITGVQNVFDKIEEYEVNYNIKIAILDRNNTLTILPNSQRYRNDIFKGRELTSFIGQWVDQINNGPNPIQNNKTATYQFNNRDTGTKSIIGVALDDEKDETIFAISSLQPVNEAVSVIEKLYLYFAIVAVLLTVVLATIYSNMIAKPLVKINKVATKMAKLDFSEKCVVNGEDEINNVALSLNFLSENLDSALTSLKQANAELEQDIEKERRLEKTRKEFVAAVSHELKTPISLIDGYAVGLKDDIFEDEDKDYYLDIIIDEAEKMGNLVTDMLDLSYLESGSFKLIRQEFNLTELINFTLKKYGTLMDEKRVKIELSLIDEIKVFADWNRLEQVLTNFITNAIRHVNENGTIYISTIDMDDSISIEIENTGSTIAEEELSKIWDKFYKIDKSRTRKLGGTGIGLSIVKNILMHHDYSFGVENTDRGVKFYFSVPKK